MRETGHQRLEYVWMGSKDCNIMKVWNNMWLSLRHDVQVVSVCLLSLSHFVPAPLSRRVFTSCLKGFKPNT